eukprot:1160939-Rhodomonas_salina.1
MPQQTLGPIFPTRAVVVAKLSLPFKFIGPYALEPRSNGGQRNKSVTRRTEEVDRTRKGCWEDTGEKKKKSAPASVLTHCLLSALCGCMADGGLRKKESRQSQVLEAAFSEQLELY